MKAEDVIIAPVITEKSNDGLQEGKYTFKVNKKATKVDIASTRCKYNECKRKNKENGKNIRKNF